MSQTEAALQRSIVHLLRHSLPHGWLPVAVANKPRSRVSGAIEKSMGACAGFPDLMLFGRMEDEPCIFLMEVKTPVGRIQPVQRHVHDRLAYIGFDVAVVRSLDDVQAVARDCGWSWRSAL